MAELPTEKTIWVHCAGAYRASIAASLIQNAGFSVVLINEPYEKVFSVPELPLVTGATDQGPVAPSDAKKT
jgi:rhodanese-related sulfurtransferase